MIKKEQASVRSKATASNSLTSASPLSPRTVAAAIVGTLLLVALGYTLLSGRPASVETSTKLSKAEEEQIAWWDSKARSSQGQIDRLSNADQNKAVKLAGNRNKAAQILYNNYQFSLPPQKRQNIVNIREDVRRVQAPVVTPCEQMKIKYPNEYARAVASGTCR